MSSAYLLSHQKLAEKIAVGEHKRARTKVKKALVSRVGEDSENQNVSLMISTSFYKLYPISAPVVIDQKCYSRPVKPIISHLASKAG